MSMSASNAGSHSFRDPHDHDECSSGSDSSSTSSRRSGTPKVQAATFSAPSTAIFHDSMSWDRQNGGDRPCHLFYAYEDDKSLPDLIRAKAAVHVDLALPPSCPPPSTARRREADQGLEMREKDLEREEGRASSVSLTIKDCRSLHPSSLRIYGAEITPSGSSPSVTSRQEKKCEGGKEGGVLRLYGFCKPSTEAESPDDILQGMEQRNQLLRAALAGEGLKRT
ncbi:Hypothetical protein NocV09_09300060 [Nannochloropsis oceanica]